MSGVAFILELLALISLVVWVFARWPRWQGGIWLVSALFMLWVLGQWPADRPVLVVGHPIWLEGAWSVVGISFQLDSVARAVLRLMWIAIGIWAIGALLVPRWGRGLGWLPVAVFGLFVAVTLQPMWALGWGIAMWAVGVLIVAYGSWPGREWTTWQWLLPPVIGALLLFLLLIWPDPNLTGIEPWRVRVVMGVLVLLSGLVPIHVGAVGLGSNARPMGATWAWWTHSLVMLTLLWRVGSHPGFRPAEWSASPVLLFLTTVTMLWAGLGALSTQDLGRLGGYAALYNWALTLTFWLHAPLNMAGFRWTLAIRLVGLFTVGLALSALADEVRVRTFDHVRGRARRRPWAVAAWAVGLATLAGTPFTPGVWSQWMMHTQIPDAASLPWFSLAGSLGIALGIVRALVALWGPLSTPLLPREEGVSKMVMLVLAMAGIGLSLVPQFVMRLGAFLL